MSQLQNITFTLPSVEVDQRRAFEKLTQLVRSESTSVLDTDFFPKVTFEHGSSKVASVTFEADYEIPLEGSTSGHKIAGIQKLRLDEVCKRFTGHILEVDHAGINLAPRSIGVERIEAILRYVANSTSLYEYPDGQPWYFVIPTTERERKGSISDFTHVRRPKFELVAEEAGPTPLIQIDLATNLHREEVEERLPAPYGIGLPGLTDFFRSVFVEHPWRGFDMRLDFRYDTERVNDWSSGKWLVTMGRRCKYE